MRNILLILLLANILYLVWGMFPREVDAPGVEVVNESQLGPPLSVAQEPTPEIVESVGAVLGSGEPSDLNAVVGRSCVTVGPLRKEDSDRAQAMYAGEGMRVAERSIRGQVFVGHWVQIRGVESRAAGNEMLRQLNEIGFGEAYIVETEDEGMKISIGLFGEMDRAEAVELEVKSVGLPADVSARTTEGTVYFVDIALPAGRGAAEIIELHGEELVALRDAATCP